MTQAVRSWHSALVVPVFWTIEAGAEGARTVLLLVVLALSAFIVVDGLRTQGREKLPSLLAQGTGFLLVAGALVLLFVQPERLPQGVRIELRSWGLAAVVGMSSCYFLQKHFGKRAGLGGEDVLNIWLFGGFLGLFSARLLHVAVNWSDYSASPLSALRIWDGGVAFIGAVIPSLVFAWLYLRRKGLGLAALDALVLGVALTHGFGRIGCFLAGCCYGKPTELPVGVRFGPGSIAHFTMVQSGALFPSEWTPPLHPTQLYEAGLSFLIGLTLLSWARRRRFGPGAITFAYFVLYPVARGLLEVLRDDPERSFLFRFPEASPVMLSTTQTVSLLVLPFALLGWRWAARSPAEGRS